jgi:dTDP-4-dehydrorhamnose reductase
MLGREVEALLRSNTIEHLCSDQEVDIGDPAALRDFAANNRVKALDWIVNCSGYTAVDRAEDEPQQAFRINAEGVRNVSETAKTLEAALIHISTDYVFSGDKNSEYLEEDPTCPIGVYARSKLQGEQHVQETLTRFYILRTAWLYGTSGTNFLRTMLRLFQERNTVRVVSDQFGSPTYARDLANLILHIIRNNGDSYGVYHYTNAGNTSWYEFAREIYRQAKRAGLVNRDVDIVPIATKDYPTRARRPPYSCLSKEKIRDTFGVTIRSWQEALRECIEELKKDS